jgi:hypothetical protein
VSEETAVTTVSANQQAEDKRDEARVKVAQELAISERGVEVFTVEQGVALATACWRSGLLPSGIKSGAQAFTIMMAGAELGLKRFAAWKGLYLTKANTIAATTKTALAVVQNSGLLEDYKETIEDEDQPTMRAVVYAKRKGRPTPIIETFSLKDAEVAGLLGKRTSRDGREYDSTYAKYPKDMLRSRARGRALDQGFSDVLSGMDVEGVAEDVAEAIVERGEATTAPVAAAGPDPLAASIGAMSKAEQPTKAPEVLTVEPLPEEDDEAEVSASVDEALGPPATEPAKKPAVAPGRCPRCKTKLNAMGGCDLCGWPTADLGGKAK